MSEQTVDVVFRLKFDPRHDGRTASPGELVAFWVQWSCPDNGIYLVQVVEVDEGDVDTMTTTECTSWRDVDQMAQSVGVEVISHPVCLGY
jgi:hypothetical protein